MIPTNFSLSCLILASNGDGKSNLEPSDPGRRRADRASRGNHYFPPESVKREFLETSSHTTICPWKGTAHYYHLVVGGKKNENAAWYYPKPKAAAANIKDHLAFWKGVDVES